MISRGETGVVVTVLEGESQRGRRVRLRGTR